MGTVIGVGGPKGGTGKTTLAVNLAAAAACDGLSVGLIDSDKELESASKWNGRRKVLVTVPQFDCVHVFGDIRRTIESMMKDYDVLIVDTPGMDSFEMKCAGVRSDVFLAPFRPGRFDLDTAERVASHIADSLLFNPALRPYTLLNELSNNPRSKTAERAIEILDALPLRRLRSALHHLDAYKDSSDLGRGVVELSNPKAVADIRGIIKEAELW